MFDGGVRFPGSPGFFMLDPWDGFGKLPADRGSITERKNGFGF